MQICDAGERFRCGGQGETHRCGGCAIGAAKEVIGPSPKIKSRVKDLKHSRDPSGQPFRQRALMSNIMVGSACHSMAEAIH